MRQLVMFNLRNLFNFKGRQTRGQFWPYVGVVFVLMMAAYMAIFIPIFVSAFMSMQQFAAENPDQVTIQQGPGHYSMQIEGSHPELMPDFSAVFAGTAILSILSILLLGAAVARRLHDTNRTGAWGAVPAVLLLISAGTMSSIFGNLAASAGTGPDTGLFLTMFLSNLFYMVSLLALIILLCMDGTKGENRYGAAEG